MDSCPSSPDVAEAALVAEEPAQEAEPAQEEEEEQEEQALLFDYDDDVAYSDVSTGQGSQPPSSFSSTAASYSFTAATAEKEEEEEEEEEYDGDVVVDIGSGRVGALDTALVPFARERRPIGSRGEGEGDGDSDTDEGGQADNQPEMQAAAYWA